MQIHLAVQQVMSQLTNAGFEAFVVGGCVRDRLRGVPPHDWDVTTNALPHQLLSVFDGWKVIPTGIKHGTVTIMVENEPIEVTTYRVDGAYTDHRRPDRVIFTPSLEEELARRDFTVNAMAYHPDKGLIDPFGGKADLDAGIIRCVGDPHRRFEEDALRIMRGLRFASTLSFVIEDKTAEAIHSKAPLLQAVAAERTYQELKGLLLGDGAREVLLSYPDVLEEFIPEIKAMRECDQHHPCHIADVYTHSVLALAKAPKDIILRLTMLLHDCGKPLCHTADEEGIDHFYGHAKLGQELVGHRLLALKAERHTIDTVSSLIHHHDALFPATRPVIKHWLNRLGEENFRLLLQVKRADALGQHPAVWEERTAVIDQLENTLDELLAEAPCFDRSQLAVNGHDLMALGITGRKVGRVMDDLLTEVIEERLKNEKSALLTWTKAQIKTTE